MNSGLATRPSLLVRLRDRQDRESWRQFELTYRPFIVGFARTKLPPGYEADDVWQDVLLALHRSLDDFKYDPSRSFFCWLRKVMLNKIRDAGRRARGEVHGSGRTSIQELLDQHPAPDKAAQFDREYLEWVAEKVRLRFDPKTFLAFSLVAVEGLPVDVVAQRLEMTENAVRIAKHRVLQAVKAFLANLEIEQPLAEARPS